MSLLNLLERAAAGGRLSYEEGVDLYKHADLHDLGAAAHARRMQLHPRDRVTYVIDTTINYTNVCNVHCTFCAFFRPEKHKEGRTMSHDDVLARVRYAADQGATQIMIENLADTVTQDDVHELMARMGAAFLLFSLHPLAPQSRPELR